MTIYIERHGWCSSLISSTMCPSTVGKSTKPCPILSSSPASTSLISNGDSISINTDSISPSSLSPSKNKKASTSFVRSSFGQVTNDYYTNKRIEELHERMDDIQISSFLKFINHHLSLKKDQEKIHIDDLAKDLANGHVLIDLIEILSSTKLKRERGQTRFHSLTNVQYVLDYLKSRMQHINISPHEIVSGNRKQILALLWIIMKTFDFPGFRLTNKHCFVENTLLGCGQDRSLIIKWLNNILNQSLHTIQIYIKDFYIQTWMNGYYFSVIMKYLLPLSVNYLTIKCFDYLKELDHLKSHDQERFQLCLTLSNYCFNTITIVDSTDKSERCLFKYFTELQQNILIILKSNHIGKLIQNNPYTKQILDTVRQTTATEHSSHIINNNNHEQYLTCIEETNQQHVPVEKHAKLPMNAGGHLVASLNGTNDLANLRTVEKSRLFNGQRQKSESKRRNRWEKSENLPSTSQVVNGYQEASKEAQVDAVIDTQQLHHVLRKSEQIVLLEEISEQATVEQTKITDKETERTILANVENQLNGRLEQPSIETQQSVLSDKENKQYANHYEKPEETNRCIKDEISISSNEILDQSINILKELEESIMPFEELHVLVTPNGDNKSSSDEYEKLEHTEILLEEIEQSIKHKSYCTRSEHSTTKNEEPEQLLPSAKEVEQSDDDETVSSEQIVPTTMENQHPIIINGKFEQPLETKSTTCTSNESPQLVISNLETTIKPVKINESMRQSASEESSQVILSTDKNNSVPARNNKKPSLPVVVLKKEHTDNGIDNEPVVTSNVELKRTECKKVDESLISTEAIQHSTEYQPFIITNMKCEQSNHRKSDKDIEQIGRINPTKTNGQFEQSVTAEVPSRIISNEKTTTTLGADSPSIVANKNLEKPIIIASQQRISSNDEVNKPATTHKKCTVTTKKATPTISSNKENQHLTTSNKQSTIVVKEPEQHKIETEQPARTTSKGEKQSDMINIQSSKVNNESTRAADSLEKQEQSTVSLEKSKQMAIKTEVTEHAPMTSVNNKSEQSQASLEKQEQPISVIEESCASATSNHSTKKTSPKNKKSRRTNGKNEKLGNASKHIDDSEAIMVINEVAKIAPLSASLHRTKNVHDQQPINLVVEIQTSSAVPIVSSDDKIFNHDDNTHNSSALRSRKTKKKKTIATTATTLIEKPPLPPMPTATNRNILVTIQDYLLDRKILASKCVFILACLCFSIIIIVLFHK